MQVLEEEMDKLKATLGAAVYEGGKFELAIQLFTTMTLAPEFEEFLTVPGYEYLK